MGLKDLKSIYANGTLNTDFTVGDKNLFSPTNTTKFETGIRNLTSPTQTIEFQSGVNNLTSPIQGSKLIDMSSGLAKDNK